MTANQPKPETIPDCEACNGFGFREDVDCTKYDCDDCLNTGKASAVCVCCDEREPCATVPDDVTPGETMRVCLPCLAHCAMDEAS